MTTSPTHKNSNTAAHFNRAAATYAAQPGVQATVAKRLADMLKSRTETGDFSLMEAGCGTGYLTRELCRLFPDSRMLAVDIAETMLEETRQHINGHHKNLEFMQADISTLKLRSRFSLIVSSSSLHWMMPLESTFSNLKKCLRPDGRIIFAMMVDGTLRELQTLRAQIAPAKKSSRKLPTETDVMTALQTSGFTINRWGTETLTPPYPSPAAFLETLRRQGVTGGFSNSSTLLTRGEMRQLMHQYRKRYSQADGRVTATYKILYAEGIPT